MLGGVLAEADPGLGGTFLAFLCSLGVWAWCWWCSRPERLRRTSEVRMHYPSWLRMGLNVEQDFRYQQAVMRWVVMPLLSIAVLVLFGLVVRQLLM